jgi:hypothetical protein
MAPPWGPGARMGPDVRCAGASFHAAVTNHHLKWQRRLSSRVGLQAPARWSPIPNPLSGRRSIRYLPLRDVSHSIAQPMIARAATKKRRGDDILLRQRCGRFGRHDQFSRMGHCHIRHGGANQRNFRVRTRGCSCLWGQDLQGLWRNTVSHLNVPTCRT